ncbi:MAG: DUF1573 domain-containing protein [Candidatus Omnitrophota bacterium]
MRIFVIMLVMVSLLFLVCGLIRAQGQEPDEKQEDYLWDFGEVSPGEILSHTFELSNDLSVPLHIDKIHTTCGCTVVQAEEKEILPGESVDINVKYTTPKRAGSKKQLIYIFTDREERSLIKFTLKAYIKEPDYPLDNELMVSDEPQ